MKYLLAAGIMASLQIMSAHADAATQRDNDVYFAITGVQSFSYTDSEHSIHSDQPWSGIVSNTSHPGSEGHILVKAGRKGSSAVAQWFKDRVAAGQTLACDSKGNFPDELNFSARGTLIFVVGTRQITCEDILIGQGHFATANNWWMGGPHMQGAHVSVTGATTQTCRVFNQVLPVEVIFSPQTPCSNHFNISVIGVQ